MKYLNWFLFLTILNYGCSNQAEVHESKNANCDLVFNPQKMDSFYLKGMDFYFNLTSYLDFFEIRKWKEENPSDKGIKNITTEFLKKEAFDETSVSTVSKSYELKVKGPKNHDSILSNSLFCSGGVGYVHFYYQYNINGYIKQIDKYSKPFKKKKCYIGRQTFYYDTNGNLVKQVLSDFRNDLNCWGDSSAIKYLYENNKLIRIRVYSKQYPLSQYSLFYDYNINRIIVSKYWYDFLKGDYQPNSCEETILQFDNSCQIANITQVSIIKIKDNTRRYSKLEINEHKDFTSYFEYEYSPKKDESLDYIEKPDNSKIKIKEFYQIEYKYDKKGNWIEEEFNGQEVIKRKIVYY